MTKRGNGHKGKGSWTEIVCDLDCFFGSCLLLRLLLVPVYCHINEAVDGEELLVCGGTQGSAHCLGS